jgi:predicted transcriptional regulator
MNDFCNEASYILFNTLDSRIRLAIIDSLRTGPKSLNETATSLGQLQEVILENIAQLEKCSLVFSEGSGKEKQYKLNKETIEPLTHLLSTHISKHCPDMTSCIPQDKLKEYMKKEADRAMYITRE